MKYHKSLIYYILLCFIFILSGCSSNKPIIKQAILETKFFTLTVPNNKIEISEHYNGEFNQYNIELNIKSHTENKTVPLIGFELTPLDKPDYIIYSLETKKYTPIGIITTQTGNSYFLSSYLIDNSNNALKKEEIDNIISSLNTKQNINLKKSDKTMIDEIKSSIDDTPFILSELNIINHSFNSFKNQFGHYWADITNNENLINLHLMNRLPNTSYYFNYNKVVAVKDDTVVAFTFIPYKESYFSGRSRVPEVREIIKYLNMHELFDVTPKIYNTVKKHLFHYSWMASNGYISFYVSGINEQKWLYNNEVQSIILYSNKNYSTIHN